MEILVLGLFCLLLLGTVFFKGSLVLALFWGLLLFWGYGLCRRMAPISLLRMTIHGIMAARNILMTFMFIGVLTAFWRASGTIPAIVGQAAEWISPSLVVALTFVMNGAVSFLLGSSFATAATMGVISMTMAQGLGASHILTGGAMLGGIYFGDRCSPVSTSALLVSELTKTDIYHNIRHMFRSALVPVAGSILFYLCLGRGETAVGGQREIVDFSSHFFLGFPVLLPAVAILVLGFFHVAVKKTMAISILLAGICAVCFQHVPLASLFHMALFGYHPAHGELDSVLGGGGLVSMVKVAAIVCLSSSFAGIFQGTGMLDRIRDKIMDLSERAGPFGALVLVSAAAAVTACNQTLAIMVTWELGKPLMEDREEIALAMEDSVVVMAALVPWSIACAMPLESVGAPAAAIPAAIYLWLLPLWHWGMEASGHRWI